jgi:hypothetical protein
METQADRRNLGWGVVLITFGLVAMMDVFTGVTEWVKVGILAAGGLVLVVLFLADRSDWGLLIPTYVLLSTALIAAVALLDFLEGDIMGGVVLILVGLPFLAVYLRDREQWWAIIPAYIMLAIALMLLLTEWNIMGDELVAPFVLTSIALPFLVIYSRDREKWWSLIPAYTMLVIALMVGLIEVGVLDDLLVPAYINLAIALPFFYVYARNRQSWWALIPGGIMAVIGLAFLMSEGFVQYVLPAVLITAGVWILVRQFKEK